jgi:elongation factor 3
LRVAYIAQHAFHHIEEHLEKSATAYIKWRYGDGLDKELAAKASRRMSPEEKRILETPIEAKSGEKRQIEMIIGRQKLKKSFTYEIKWKNLDHRQNVWIPRERLIELGFTKIVQQFDDFESSREGSGSREMSGAAVRAHLEALGLDGNIAEYNEMSGLSGGQKVKVVIAAALWAKPQVLILDEPFVFRVSPSETLSDGHCSTNFLDRDALSGLANAIRDWPGAFVCISHNVEFVSALCPERWEVDNGVLTHRGKVRFVRLHGFRKFIRKKKVSLVEDSFDAFEARAESRETSRSNTPSVSKGAARMAAKLAARTPGSGKNSEESSAANTPIATPAGSGDEAASPTAAPLPKVSKKKLTRKQVKDREERRRQRTLDFLTNSIPGAVVRPSRLSRAALIVLQREPDTESD